MAKAPRMIKGQAKSGVTVSKFDAKKAVKNAGKGQKNGKTRRS